ncbi:MAG: hypothetical protein ABIN58_10600 [candidate division WOR-3 bacterium]
MAQRIGLLLIVLLFWIAPTFAAEPQLTPRQQQIFKSILAVDAELTKEQYDQFWANFPKLTPEQRKELYKKLEPVMLMDLERQRGAWMSAKETIKQKKIVYVPDYEKATSKMEKHYENDPVGTIRVTIAKKETDALLKAALTGKPMKKGKEDVYITKELVDQVLAGIDGSYDRVKRLMAPEWGEK